jgi:pyruvate dehydrogenase E2 component (dihydrolipoamide acetyltransferase)
MPKMGYDMREGTVVRWYKQEGDEVARGEVIADIETDKATVEFEAFTGGVLHKLVAQEGVPVPVGEAIAVIGDAGEELGLAPVETVAVEEAAVPSAAPASDSTEVVTSAPARSDGEVRASPIARRLAREQGIDLTRVTGTGPGGRIVEQDILEYKPADGAAPEVENVAAAQLAGGARSSPLARRLARERGIDLTQVVGTGPDGRIVEKDILEYVGPAPAPEPEPAVAVAPVSMPLEGAAEPAGERVDLSRMRQVIARVTGDSKRDAPHFYVTAEVDMGQAMSLRRDINDALPADNRVSVNDLVVRACAIALGRHPKFNAFFREDHLQYNTDINIGIAISLEAGLIVPGISNCGGKSLAEIAAASKDLIARANSGSLRNDEYSGTTFSVSNLGMFDVDSFAAIIFPPHAAVLAVGTVKEQPVVRDGQLAVGQVMKATLSTDHRVADGAEAAQFLVEVKGLLEKPVSLLL